MQVQCVCVCTWRLAPLVVNVQGRAPIDARHHLEVGAVEAVHSDHAGLGVEVAFVRVCGIQVVLKHSQPIEVLNLRYTEATRTQNQNIFLGVLVKTLT